MLQIVFLSQDRFSRNRWNSINTAYDPQTLHLPTPAQYKQFNLGRCHPWAEDRVM